MKSNRSPFDGQWQCDTCGRTYGRTFPRCAYCGHAVAPAPNVTQARQIAPSAPIVAGPVPRPSKGVTARVWAILDSLGAAASLPALLTAAAAEGINDSTARTQYSKWKKAMSTTP